MKRLVNKIWNFFISLRLTFILLGVLVFGAALGMSYDQTLDFDQFYQQFGHMAFYVWVIEPFELYDAFHSWWFSLAILLLSLNLIACSVERLPRIFFDACCPRPYLTNRRLNGLKFSKKVFVHDLASSYKIINKIMKNNLVKYKLPGVKNYYFREENIFARFGVYIVHIGLLIIMFSSIYTSMRGVDGHVLIEEGEKINYIEAKGSGGVRYSHDLGFYVGCDDFRLRTFIDNSPMEYESDLFIQPKNHGRILQQTVRVNQPLSYAGFTFYQSSYQPIASQKIILIKISDKNNSSKIYKTRLNQKIKISNTDNISVDKIFEDFGGIGEAIRIRQTNSKGNSTFFHVFRKYPEFDQIVRQDKIFIEYLGSDQKYLTGLSVAKVPGIEIIFAGFIVLIIGVYACFFVTPIRFFARIQKIPTGYEVDFALQAFRHEDVVKRKFSQYVC